MTPARLLAGRAGLLPAAGALLLALLVPGEGPAGLALRGLLALCALGLAAAALRAGTGPARPIALVDRQPFGRDAGLALVEVSGRRLLVGYAPRGVEVLADLTATSQAQP